MCACVCVSFMNDESRGFQTLRDSALLQHVIHAAITSRIHVHVHNNNHYAKKNINCVHVLLSNSAIE